MTFDGNYWSGWSNSKTKTLSSIDDAVLKIKNDPEIAHRIIDADNLIIWVSDMQWADRAIISAKTNFGVEITDVRVGFPE
mgnify:FL=1